MSFADVFERQCELCKACRYSSRGALDEPCSTGLSLIVYSGRCSAYKPSLKTRLREAVERLKGRD